MPRTRRTQTAFFPGDFDFTGEWYGWRLRGRLLISPHGDKLTRTRLDGIVWRESLRVRYVKSGLAVVATSAPERPIAGLLALGSGLPHA